MDEGRPKKPPYNYEALKEGVKTIDANIAKFREAIANEEKRKVEFQGHIKDWEDYFTKMSEAELLDSP